MCVGGCVSSFAFIAPPLQRVRHLRPRVSPFAVPLPLALVRCARQFLALSPILHSITIPIIFSHAIGLTSLRTGYLSPV